MPEGQMRAFIGTLLVGTAICATAANAADLPGKGPIFKAPPPIVYPWTGFYVGVNAGAGWSRETYTTAPGATLVTIPFDGSLGWGQNLTGTSDAGFTGGGQIGFNWQAL